MSTPQNVTASSSTALRNARRIVVKVGSSLVTNEGRGLDDVAIGSVEVGREGDRDRPVVAGGGPHVLADLLVVLGALEAGQGRKGARRDHLEVGGVALGKCQGKLGHRLAHCRIEVLVD